MNNNIFINNKSKILKGKSFIILAAILIVSGFFVANFALAAHTTTVTVDPLYVAGSSSNTYTFEVTNEGTDPIYLIRIMAPEGFTITDDVICPIDSSETYDWSSSYTSTYASCQTSGNPANSNLITQANSGTIIFTATAPSPINDTNYSWIIYTEDNDWGVNTNNIDAQTIVDVEAPETSIEGIPVDWVGSDVSVILTPNDGIGIDDSTTYSCVYNEGEAACDPITVGTSLDVICTEEAVCQQIVRYYSVDSLGNSETPKDSSIIYIDKEKPITLITVGIPKYEGEFTYVTFDTEFTLSDDDGTGSGVASTEYKIDEGQATVYSIPFNLSEISEGPHTISYWSTDNVGNIEENNSLSIFIDDSAPIISDLTISPIHNDGETNYISGVSNISALVNDGDGSGIESCEYTLNGGADWTAANYSEGICSVEDVDSSAANSINMRAVDNVGNTGEGTAVNVSSDTINPTITIDTPPADWQNIDATLTINCIDDDSGCSATVGYELHINQPGNCSTDIEDYIINNPVTVSSHQWICAYGEDNVGNSSVSEPAEIKVDEEIPTISDDYINGWENSEQTVTLTPNDTGGSGINEVRLNGDILTSPYQINYSSEGIFIENYQVWDNAGNASEVGSYTVQIDLTDPDAGISGNPEDWTNITQTASITCSDEAGIVNSSCNEESFKYKIYTSDPVGTCSSNVEDYTFGTSAEITQHSWVCSYVEDNAGNSDFSDSPVEFKVDRTLPSGELIGVPPVWQNINADIDLTSDDEGGSSVANSYLSDVPYGDTCEATMPYVGSIVISEYSTVCWKVVDVAGNVNEGSEDIMVDKLASVSEVTSPEVGSWFKDDFSVNISDEDTGGSGLNTCEYNINDNGWMERDCNEEITVTVGVEEDCDIEGEGVCSVSVKSTDIATNLSEINTRAFNVDWTVPTANISSPISEDIIRDSEVEIVFEVNGTVSPISQCFYQIDEQERQEIPDCVSPYIIADFPDGRHNIKVIAEDAAANEAESNTVNLLIDIDNTFRVDDSVENNPDFTTIQEAIANALDNYTISIADGNYILSSTLNLALSDLTIFGDSESDVVIDASDVSGYGIAPSADNMTLEGFTLMGPTVDAGTSYGIKASHISNFTMSNVTVQGSGRSEFDLNTVDGGLLENITADGENTKGVGVALSYSNNITLRDITTQDNTWGGVGLYDTPEGQTTNVVFEGTNNLEEDNPVYIDAEYDFGVSNITLPEGFDYAVRNTFFRDAESENRSEAFTFFQNSQENAVNFALALQSDPYPVNTDSYIQTLGIGGTLENNFIVGDEMSIQTAINAATFGGIINVAAGTYNESLLIEKSLTLNGVGEKPIITGDDSMNNFILKVNGSSNVVLSNLEVNGGGTGTDENNFTYGILVNDSDEVTITNSVIKNVWKNQADGINIQNSVGIDIYENTISSFQKRGIRYLNSEGIFHGNEVIGDHIDGTTRVQNLVNVFDGSSIEIYENELHDGLSTEDSPTWDSPGIFVSSYAWDGTESDSYADIHDNEIYNCDSGIIVGSAYATIDMSIVDITNNNLHDLGWAINFEVNTVSATIIGNSFTNNEIAVNSQGFDPIVGPIVNAQGNWWGSIEGPTHIDNPFGTGNIVANDNTDYRPWCTDANCSEIDGDAPIATLSGTPNNPTSETTADITVNGDGVIYYKYELDSGDYNAETSIGTSIIILDLEEGSHTISVIGRDQAGNWQSVATSYTWEVDATDPTLNPVSVVSDNANLVWAKVGDTISLTFTSSESIQIPIVTIAGKAAIISGEDSSWTATYTMISEDAEGLIAFTIDFSDLAGNDGEQVIATTDASSVTFDKTAPVVEITDPISDSNVNGDAVVEFTNTEETNPQCSFDEDTWDECVSGTTILTDMSGFTELGEGSFTLYLRDIDAAGNTGTDSQSLIKDTEAPTVESHIPSNLAVGIDPALNITVTFGEIVNISSGNIILQIEGKDPLSVTVTFDDSSKIATINPDSDLSDNSRYDITLSGVTDLANNMMGDYGWSFTTAASYSIELKTGWNLISLPVTPTTWANTEEVLESINGNIERVWSYDAVGGEWYIYNADGSPSNLDIMTAGHGYWVKMTGDDTLEGVGTLYEQLIPSGDTPPSQLPEIPLAQGWNLIGYYQLPGETTSFIANALSKLDGAWSGIGSNLIAFNNGTLEIKTPITVMSPGEGYWIFMTDSRKYSFGSATD